VRSQVGWGSGEGYNALAEQHLEPLQGNRGLGQVNGQVGVSPGGVHGGGTGSGLVTWEYQGIGDVFQGLP
jgi:hypothetical protein